MKLLDSAAMLDIPSSGLLQKSDSGVLGTSLRCCERKGDILHNGSQHLHDWVIVLAVVAGSIVHMNDLLRAMRIPQVGIVLNGVIANGYDEI